VLSTPPAFILSQDQTLLKNIDPGQNKLGFLFTLNLLFVRIVRYSSENLLWNLFRVALLFICQGAVCCITDATDLY